MKLISSDEAAALLADGWTVSTSGFTGSGHPEGITTAIEKRFLGGHWGAAARRSSTSRSGRCSRCATAG